MPDLVCRDRSSRLFMPLSPFVFAPLFALRVPDHLGAVCYFGRTLTPPPIMPGADAGPTGQGCAPATGVEQFGHGALSSSASCSRRDPSGKRLRLSQ